MPAKSIRRRAYELLERDASHDAAARWLHRALLLIIVVNVGCCIVDTIPSVHDSYDAIFDNIEIVSLVVFGVEYLIRLWVSPENPLFQREDDNKARFAWACSSAGVVDLIAVAPFLISLAVDIDLRVIVLLRLLRFFKIARYSPGFRSLSAAVRAERHALGACLVILISVILISSGLIYTVESAAQPDKFGSIPEAMWWAAATVTTVGYGDVVPVTMIGRVIGVFTMISGLLMLALPAGIIATSFASIISRHNFVVTAAMVARMPLFQGLDAGAIIDLLPLIGTRSYNTAAYILHRTDPAQALYVVAEGRVVIERGRDGHVLGPGQAFGSATRAQFDVRAVSAVKLLVIESYDVRVISRLYPHIGERIATLENLIRRPPTAAAPVK